MENESKPIRPDQAGGQTGQPNFGEREYEVGSDEFWKGAHGNLYNNMKRSYDEYQHESLESIRRNRSHVDVVLSNAESHNVRINQLAEQALQNAIETANMVGKGAVKFNDALDKQHLAHRDVATDATWNPVQQGAGDALTARAVTIDDASLKAIGAAIAAALATALNQKPSA